eukprot:CAMPEP_0202714078 /NCGR_PEP_ID=MMETSP1385-20130828/62313_1 /ASSEMBLY_ACC=CAM_ASM_000861 /TAXON_ID=933848 /ORGANISM="Elphidium margaritaceum" /LENGTH=388 /DNA_ID=CAMNT_0049374649 /DNA_START=24 /DNA_END=1190 /DNA_ORIENTATION=+
MTTPPMNTPLPRDSEYSSKMYPTDVMIPVVVFLTVIFLLWLCCAIRISYVLYFSGSDIAKSIHKYLRISAMNYFFSYCVAYFVVLLWVILVQSNRTSYYLPEFDEDERRYVRDREGHGSMVLFAIICVTVCIGFFSYYVHLILRLYFAFARTTFAVKSRAIKVHIIIAAIVAILFLFLSLSYFVLRHLMRGIEDQGFDIVSLQVTAPIGALAYVLNICNVVAILGKFANRLLSVAASRIDSFRDSDSGFSARQQALVPVAAKHCLLGFMGITSFNILIPIAMISYVRQNAARDSGVGGFMATFSFCIALHSIEMVAVFLSFSFNTPHYQRICKPCNALCMWCLTKETHRRLKQPKTPSSAHAHSSSVASTPNLVEQSIQVGMDETPKE